MFKKALIQADLTPSQAEILEFLYQNKESKASEIAKKIKRSRAIVYKEAEELASLGLLEKIEKPNQITLYQANHPSMLSKLIDRKEAQIKKDKELLESYLPDMISNYNLMFNKPGVKYYEGLEGIKKVLWDTLTSKETIMAYSDIEAVDKFIPSLNDEYVAKRKKLMVKKRGLILDTPFSRKFLENYYPEITENRYIPGDLYPFSTLLQVYDNKIAYITLSEESLIGVLIEDKNIYQMHKSLFEFAWRHAKTADQLQGLSKAQ
jgi:sugar-specific transcriptional regulator TrmB